MLRNRAMRKSGITVSVQPVSVVLHYMVPLLAIGYA